MLPETEKLINEFSDQAIKILQENLVGIYLHGSSVMGCFNPKKSDLDLIIVVRQPISDSVKRRFMDMVVQYNDLGPAKGIEMSIVLQEVCDPFLYPTPFELHFSSGHLEWYKNDPDGYIQKMNGTDKDLAAHFMIIQTKGKCLCGLPIKEVFADVPKCDYIDSIKYDIEGAVDGIEAHTMYLTLNLARVLAYLKEGVILSKKEGGDWAISHLPAKYHPLIRDAMNEYTDNAEVVYNIALAKRYAEYVLKQIGEYS